MVFLPSPTVQGPEKHTNITKYFQEAGFDVLSAVPRRRATFHDWFPMGLGNFFYDPGSQESSFMFHSFLCLFGALSHRSFRIVRSDTTGALVAPYVFHIASRHYLVPQ